MLTYADSIYLYAEYAFSFQLTNPSKLSQALDIRMQATVLSHMLTYAHVCAHICSRMLTYVHVCSRMLAYAVQIGDSHSANGYRQADAAVSKCCHSAVLYGTQFTRFTRTTVLHLLASLVHTYEF